MPIKFDINNASTLGSVIAGFYVLYQVWKRRKSEEIWSKQCQVAKTNVGAMATEAKPRCALHIDHKKVVIVETPNEWEHCVDQLLKELSVVKLLGLDAEWVTRDGKMRPVSLLQLATLDGMCILIRLHLMPHIPATLRAILADKSIIKAGVAVCQDAKKLSCYGLEVNGCVDLNNLTTRARLQKRHEKGSHGLQGIANRVLHVTLDKDPKIRHGNWEAPTLKPKQIAYAAKDALVGAFAFWRMVSMKLNCSLPVQFLEKSPENWSRALSCCQGIVDLDFRHDKKTPAKSKPGKSNKALQAETNGVSPSLSKAYVARKTPLYHHSALLAPDGQLLCTCDTKKAQWYIDKGLGVKIQDDPLKVQLNFEPSGRPIDENNYYTQDKQNMCVVCGASDSYIRKSIIPHEYRKYFPQVMKEHRSHDVLLMCLSCHQRSNLFDADLKEKLAQQCDAPLDSGEFGRYKRDHSIHKVKSAAKALLSKSSNIPESRKSLLEETVKDYFCVDTLDDAFLEQAKELDPKVEKVDHISHGYQIFIYWRDTFAYNGLQDFEKKWRQHFLDTMQPRFLPPGWSVDFGHADMEKQHFALLHLSNAMVDFVTDCLVA